MPHLGFEPITPLFEKEKTVHALDRTATVFDRYVNYECKIDKDVRTKKRWLL
jgi:hypothetical protein